MIYIYVHKDFHKRCSSARNALSKKSTLSRTRLRSYHRERERERERASLDFALRTTCEVGIERLSFDVSQRPPVANSAFSGPLRQVAPEAFRLGSDRVLAEDAGESYRSALERQRLVGMIVALMKALEDVSLEDSALIACARRLREALLATKVGSPALLSAPLEKGMQAQRSDLVRCALVKVAGELRAVDSLRRLAIFDSSSAVRRQAVASLGWNGAARELRELVLAGDDDKHVRSDALEWLARLDDADGLAERGLLGDRDAELRARAAELLGDVAARRCARGDSVLDEDDSSRTSSMLPCREPCALLPVSGGILPRALLARVRGTWYANAVRSLGVALTSDGNARVRLACAHQLARLRAVEALGSGLRDKEQRVRLRVVEHLGELAEERCCDPLEQALKLDSDCAVRRCAQERLGELGDPRHAVDRFGCRDEDEETRCAAVTWLGRLSRPGALLTPLTDERSPKVREASARQLAELFEEHQSARSDGGLLQQQQQHNSQHSSQQVEDASLFRTALNLRLGDAERPVRAQAARALAALDENMWLDLVRGDDGDCERLRRVPGPRTTAVLVLILQNAADVADRRDAARQLGLRKDAPPLVTNALCACCAQRAQLPAVLRCAALRALEQLAPIYAGAESLLVFPEGLESALKISLEDAQHFEVRVAAVHACGASRCAGEALQLCVKFASGPGADSRSDVRVAAATRLSRFGPQHKSAAFALLGALRDRDVGVRDAAGVSYAGFRDSAFCRELARATCAKLKLPSATEDKREPFGVSVRVSHARALGHLRESAVALEQLHEALAKERAPLVKRALCEALEQLREPRSLKPLLAPLRDVKQISTARAQSILTSHTFQ